VPSKWKKQSFEMYKKDNENITIDERVPYKEKIIEFLNISIGKKIKFYESAEINFHITNSFRIPYSVGS